MALLAAPLATAYGNGRVIQFDRRTAGPYEIAVGTIPENPVVGNLHLTMNITDTASDTLILDANVTVSARGPESETVEIGPLQAQNNLDDLSFYDVNTSVDRLGAWVFTVSVSGELGDASTEFPIEVTESSPLIAIVTLLALVAFLAALGFSLRAFLRERGRGKRRA